VLKINQNIRFFTLSMQNTNKAYAHDRSSACLDGFLLNLDAVVEIIVEVSFNLH
jgi:hypothetical protein